MSVRFSIVVPVYNVAPYLRECLDSILGQSYDNWECICVNDGSTDSSGVILDNYAIRDERIRVIHKSNHGVSSARNDALNTLVGDWVAFLDGDDVWQSDALMTLSSVIDKHPCVDVVSFGIKRFVDGVAVEWPSKSGEIKFFDTSQKMFSECLGSSFSGKIYRREIVNSVRFKPYSIGEDLLFLNECVLGADCCAIVDATLYGYRQRAGSATNSLISLRKVMDLVGYTSDILALYGASAKILPQSSVRTYINDFLERFWMQYWALCPLDREVAFVFWRVQIHHIGFGDIGSLLNKLRLRVLRCFKHRCVAILLCYIPAWLKQKGVHR